MRNNGIVGVAGVFVILAGSLLTACSDDSNTTPGASAGTAGANNGGSGGTAGTGATAGSAGAGTSGSGGSGGTAANGGTAGTSNDVTATLVDSFDNGVSIETRTIDETRWEYVRILTDDGGLTVEHPATKSGEGYVFSDVPEGNYVFQIGRTSDPATTGVTTITNNWIINSRTLDLGSKYSCRPDLTPLTESAYVSLSANLTSPWNVSFDADGNPTNSSVDDTLQLFSRNTGIVGFVGSDPTVGTDFAPLNGDLELKGWTFDIVSNSYAYTEFGISSFDESKSDTLDFLHNVSVIVEDPNQTGPWSYFAYNSTVEHCQVPPFSLEAGETVSVSCEFAPTDKKTLDFDYRGDDFVALLSDAPGPLYGTTVVTTVYMEPGTPVPMTGASASLLEFFVASDKTYDDPDCSPGCDVSLCGGSCNSPWTLEHPGTYHAEFSYGNPFTTGQELLSVQLSFRSDVTPLLSEMTTQRTSGSISMTGPLADFNGVPITPVLGLPKNVKVNGSAAPIAEITSGVGLAPTITFDAPSLGTADYYYVVVICVDDVNNSMGEQVSAQRTVGTVKTLETTVILPEGVLQQGKHYYAQVSAVSDPSFDTAAILNAQSLRQSRSQTYTGVFTP